MFRTLSLTTWIISKWADKPDLTQNRSQYLLWLLAIWIFLLNQGINDICGVCLTRRRCLFIRPLGVLSCRSINWMAAWYLLDLNERHLCQSVNNLCMKTDVAEEEASVLTRKWSDSMENTDTPQTKLRMITRSSIWPSLWVHLCTCWMRLAELNISGRHLVSVSS